MSYKRALVRTKQSGRVEHSRVFKTDKDRKEKEKEKRYILHITLIISLEIAT